MNWTWHNNFIQERLLNVEESPILLRVPSIILQLMIVLIKVIGVIMCLFLSEILNFGLLTPVEKDSQKLQLLKKKEEEKKGGLDSKESNCNVGGLGSNPRLGKSPGEGNGNQLQYSCLENPMNRGACWAILHGVAKSWTCLSN